MRRRRWSRRAARHLDGIRRYIAKDRPEAADRVVGRIVEATERLEAFPFSARRGAVKGTRELVVSGIPYIVVYVVTEDSVDIHGVFHAARAPSARRDIEW